MKLTQTLAAAGILLALAGCGASGSSSTDTSAYRDVVVAGAGSVSSAASAVSTACSAAATGDGTVAACSDAASAFKDASQTFLNQLTTVTAPSYYATGDGELRQALALYISGSQLEIDGIANMDSSMMVSGTDQVNQGTTLLGEATAAIPTP